MRTPATALAGSCATTESPTIGIVGAGIGGLTLAAALGEAGFRDVTVYDRDEPGSPCPSDLLLTPNGTRVLRALHVGPFLSDAPRPDGHVQRSWRSGR